MSDKNNLKTRIVAFRVTDEQATIVEKLLEEHPVLGVKSVNQFFRKLARDFLAGKLNYKRAGDLTLDTELQP